MPLQWTSSSLVKQRSRPPKRARRLSWISGYSVCLRTQILLANYAVGTDDERHHAGQISRPTGAMSAWTSGTATPGRIRADHPQKALPAGTLGKAPIEWLGVRDGIRNGLITAA